MPRYYNIINPDTNIKAEFNETQLLDSMRYAKNRNKELYDSLVRLWEKLNQKNFNPKYLQRYG